MTLDMQPSPFASFPYSLAACDLFPIQPTAPPADFHDYRQQRRVSRKRAHAEFDECAVDDSAGAHSKRQEVQHNVPAPTPLPPTSDATYPSHPLAPSAPPLSLLAELVSPAGSDTSMTDEAYAATNSTSGAASELRAAATARDEHASDFYHSAASIRPVLPISSQPSSAIYDLYRQQQQQQAEDDWHSPSKQLVLYQPVQPLVQLAAAGSTAGSIAAARRRARAEALQSSAASLYKWGEVGDSSSSAMQT